MSKRLIPLFPLQLVVFPRTRLPLHIFEERYKEMVGEAIRDESEFGIVLAKDGGILNAGCTVKVAKVLEMYADGRMDILTLGQYLRPSPQHLPIVRYVTPGEFADLRTAGYEMGFQHVESGPLVRSSYHASHAVAG